MRKSPDYSRYSLEELRELAGRTGKQLFSRESALLMREIEEREQAANGGRVQTSPGCLRMLLHACGGIVLAHGALVSVPEAIFPAGFSLPFALSPYGLLAAQFVVGIVIGSSVPELPRQGEGHYTWRRLLGECFALLLGFLGGAGFGWMAVSAVSLGVVLSNSTLLQGSEVESVWRLAGYGVPALAGVAGCVLSLRPQGNNRRSRRQN